MGHRNKPGPRAVHEKKLQNRAKQPPCNLSFHQVPLACREPFLLRGYRPPNYSVRQCIHSLFRLHNETGNSWTHIFACLYFLYKAYSCWQTDGGFQPEFAPLIICGFGCAAVFGVSSVAHAFNALSVIWRQRLFLLDYAGVSFSASGFAVAYMAYLPERTMFYGSKNVFIIISCLVSWMATIGCSLSMANFSGSPLAPVLKSLSFAVVAVVINLSMLRFCMSGPGSDFEDDVFTKVCWIFFIYVVLLLASGLFNAACFPERLAPGWFDYVAHGHQVFHVLIFLAYAVQFEMFSVMRENMVKTSTGYEEMKLGLLVVGVAWPIYIVTALSFFRAVDRTFAPGTFFASVPKPNQTQK